MKVILLAPVISIVFHLVLFGQNRNDTIKTEIIKVSKLHDLDQLTFDFCDTFSIEINGLYPIITTLPTLQEDSTLVKMLLQNNGFSRVDWGAGNWELGPRFIYLKFEKGDCSCRTYKKYYYNQKQKDGSYDLRVSERIICNSDKLMDE